MEKNRTVSPLHLQLVLPYTSVPADEVEIREKRFKAEFLEPEQGHLSRVLRPHLLRELHKSLLIQSVVNTTKPRSRNSHEPELFCKPVPLSILCQDRGDKSVDAEAFDSRSPCENFF